MRIQLRTYRQWAQKVQREQKVKRDDLLSENCKENEKENVKAFLLEVNMPGKSPFDKEFKIFCF